MFAKSVDHSIRWLQQGSRSIIAVACLIVIAYFFYHLISKPMWLSFNTGTCGSGVQLLNPFRSRAPEKTAEEFLGLIKANQCEEALGSLNQGVKDYKSLCEKERQYPLTSWRIRDRKDEGNKCVLSYCFKRADIQGEDILFIWLEKKEDSWCVTNYMRAF